MNSRQAPSKLSSEMISSYLWINWIFLTQPIIPPPAKLLPLLQYLKSAYLLWHQYHQVLPKVERFSLGLRVDNLFIETIEAVASASFLSPVDKAPYVRLAIRKMDTIKVLLLVLWETRSLDTKKYAAISVKLEEIGKMLGGWSGQLLKQNSPAKTGEKWRSCGRQTNRRSCRSSRSSWDSPCASSRSTRHSRRCGCPRRNCAWDYPYHCPLNTLGAVYYSASLPIELLLDTMP